MNKLKDLWRTQDLVNKIIFITGLAALVWCIAMGSGMYGVVLMLLMVAMLLSRQSSIVKRRSRSFGTLYFVMPDEEIVPFTFEQVKSEYVHGGQSRYNGRQVFLCFPWWCINSEGEGDTGFGLNIRLQDAPELAAEAAGLKRGEYVRVTGVLVAVSKNYFVIGELTELKRITQQELFPLNGKTK